jgi:hypothetical protein
MEHYQITDSIDPLLKPKDQSKTNKNELNKLTEKSNDKKRKAKSKKNDSDVVVPKKILIDSWTRQFSYDQ